MDNLKIMEEYLSVVIDMVRPFVIVLFSIVMTYIFFEMILFKA